MTQTLTQEQRTDILTEEYLNRNYAQTSRVFMYLMIGQWLFAVLLAFVVSPYAWAGKEQSVNPHVWISLGFGALLSSLPVYLAITQPSSFLTRVVVACAQMLWSAVFIHLTGGRIETHFHVFGSLAFLAFYRDWKIIVPATVTVATDHLLRGIFWPESVYGIANPEWWRFLEHAGWVVFEDIILVLGCLRGAKELRYLADRQAQAEFLAESDRTKSVALEAAMKELKDSHEQLTRSEKLAAVGQLAASVGHELRNPLAAVRNATTFLRKRVLEAKPDAAPVVGDEKVQKFFDVMDSELQASNRIITDLLDFARERKPELSPTPLRPLIDEALSVIPRRANVTVVNEVPDQLPIPSIDKHQFRQVFVNLIQNASEAIPAEREGKVIVRAEGGGDAAWRITVTDDGPGIPADIQEKIFQPLFTTKSKGTGLGLAIVSGMVLRHQGRISVSSELGRGATFTVELPSEAPSNAVAA